MSPIFVRPVREQLEHDRLIRHLILKYKRQFEVAANIGDEQLAPVKLGSGTYFPDLVLTDARKKLAGLVEVESSESVNNLEAMAQWVPFSRSRVPFHLYVPVQAFDVARRFCESHKVAVTELWTYRPAADGFDLVRMVHDASAPSRTPAKRDRPPAEEKPAAAPADVPRRAARPKPEPAPAKPSAAPAARAKTRPKSVPKPAKPAKPARPAAKKRARATKSTGSRKR